MSSATILCSSLAIMQALCTHSPADDVFLWLRIKKLVVQFTFFSVKRKNEIESASYGSKTINRNFVALAF
jgi:hypothetical protein